VKTERLADRLTRLERQIRAFKELHANELQIILDELADIRSELAPESPATAGTDSPNTDPAAGSPKRAKWLAEEAQKTRPVSRREFLRGHGKDDATS
jgi:hypothetical protein